MKKIILLATVLALWMAVPVLASRNSSGTYSLPATWNPVVSGTPITKEWANGTLNDLATEVTSSLDRSGRGAMLAPLRTPAGTAAAPAHAFSSEPSTGLYLDTTNQVCLAVLGSPRQRWTPTMSTIYTPVTLSDTADFTGVARFNHANGASITVGDLWLTAATTQGIIKQSGQLTVGTQGAFALNLATAGATRWAIDSAGNLSGTGTLASGAQTVTGGLTVPSGGVAFTQASTDQSITKTSGSLNVGTTDGNSLRLRTANTTRWTVDPSNGNLISNGSAKVTALPAPSAASDAATKGYIDQSVDMHNLVTPACATGGTTIMSISFSPNSKVRWAGRLYYPSGAALTVRCTSTQSNTTPIILTTSGAAGVTPTLYQPTTAGSNGTTTVTGQTMLAGPGIYEFHGSAYVLNSGSAGTITCQCVSSSGTLTMSTGSWYSYGYDNP